MDAISIIIKALTEGYKFAKKEVDRDDIKNAYKSLVSLIKRKFTGNKSAETVIEKYEEKPDVWEAPLKDELTNADAAADVELVAMAKQLLNMLTEGGGSSAKFDLSIGDNAKGIVVGDHTSVSMTFGANSEEEP